MVEIGKMFSDLVGKHTKSAAPTKDTTVEAQTPPEEKVVVDPEMPPLNSKVKLDNMIEEAIPGIHQGRFPQKPRHRGKKCS